MFANWKTTLIGFLGGVFISIAEVAVTGKLTWVGVGGAIISVIKGLLQKDYDTTGTGKGASKEKGVSNISFPTNPN